ncbi:protein of unknown function DUF195 [Thermosediminibacter oceani DSM 16646]|uniref:RmuC-domain protein n=1 Tax=Thermosediminibacter oceani (strain ATCC BAA-1034 / DSM 16646 / JW/IW-1228P) TaxID=555079 RepID=D9RZQ0_THEOJ|nr:protein of unknown function DUF195 [Thermosediminibacter oceani DSM 16646]
MVGMLEGKIITNINQMNMSQQNLIKNFSDTVSSLADKTEERLNRMRDTIETKLKEIQNENSSKLEQMRQTVDEKLQSTLNARISESFKLVSERLEQVHNGLGEVQTLVNDVGDLKKVLSNIKTRGILGEVQLEAIMEDILTPGQYEKNVRVKPGCGETVEFAVKIPVENGGAGNYMWLPIDTKFPMEDFERLIDAEERCDTAECERLRKELEHRLKQSAKDIKDKYICPPHTTDFAIMFLPAESLFAEALRKPGFIETLQREYKVLITGPTTLSAVLSSLRQGFKIFAIEKKAEEVWRLLGAVKTEIGKFGDLLEKVNKKLQEAQNVIEDASRKTRTIDRKLRDVEEISPEETAGLLALSSSPDDVVKNGS